MKKSLLLFIALVPTLFINGQSDQKITAAEISFVFVSKDVEGSLTGFNSSASLDFENLSNSSFKGSVEASTIKTGNFLRDWSLKGGKYFDADTHPKIAFQSTLVTKTTDGFSVEGELTIKATTKTITIAFTKAGNRLTGTTTLFSSDYGIHIKKKREDNKVAIKMLFTLR